MKLNFLLLAVWYNYLVLRSSSDIDGASIIQLGRHETRQFVR